MIAAAKPERTADSLDVFPHFRSVIPQNEELQGVIHKTILLHFLGGKKSNVKIYNVNTILRMHISHLRTYNLHMYMKHIILFLYTRVHILFTC